MRPGGREFHSARSFNQCLSHACASSCDKACARHSTMEPSSLPEGLPKRTGVAPNRRIAPMRPVTAPCELQPAYLAYLANAHIASASHQWPADKNRQRECSDGCGTRSRRSRRDPIGPKQCSRHPQWSAQRAGANRVGGLGQFFQICAFGTNASRRTPFARMESSPTLFCVWPAPLIGWARAALRLSTRGARDAGS
jgi:hypothetical protein